VYVHELIWLIDTDRSKARLDRMMSLQF